MQNGRKNSVLLKNVLSNGKLSDILIVGNQFQKIAPAHSLPEMPVQLSDDSAYSLKQNFKVVDCSGLAILPPFYNAHTHAAMTLLRGYADDMPLFKWLSEYIWPAEAKWTPEAIYAASRLAILEMIRSGTVFFADMYWHRLETMRAAEEMGVRALIGVCFAENLDKNYDKDFQFLDERRGVTERVKLGVMPHSIYTVGDELFCRCAEYAQKNQLILHTHLAETEKEVTDCLKRTGKTPVAHLQELGVLNHQTVIAHSVHVSDGDISILKESGTSVVHCPASNLKLSSGLFKMQKMLDAAIPVALGTDGASSNNNLDMHEEMKLAALLAKRENPETLSARAAIQMATVNGARAFGLNAGVIQEGMLADALLIDLSNERLIPNYHLESNWVYSADSRSIVSVLCDGKFIMENRIIPNEQEIISEAVKYTSVLSS